ncbi:type II secretion system protein [Halanaerobium kushneri]|jgi:prepilin-type N-terminal cleavage/methylation domain-containing protein|uniref:General secretion pathway protein G n=1 Tax=Halanaerobium kushneri TaxID=56779 RepID=A0A1N6Q8K8_9FIRM|nr:prepilin-type N-terminal cleavage/methylation domain-containing protein [Halanaerobium kushneri]SIQ12766.1 general secretion pathway protein G [Halanaerobium kushneri]
MRKFREILAGGDKGFTLIELLVVIAVLGILAGIAIPRLTGVRDKAVYASGQATLDNLSTYVNMYFTENTTTGSINFDTIVAEYTDNSSVSDIMSDGWSLPSGTTTISSGATTITLENTDGDINDLQIDLNTGDISGN